MKKKKNTLPKRIALRDNIVIEKALGDSHGIICVEDLVHELTNCSGDGVVFSACMKFLWPFRLSAPKSVYQRNTLKYLEGREDYGDMGDAIVDYVRNIL